MFGKTGTVQAQRHILDETEIVDGIDELGVPVYGRTKSAYRYGSQLSIEETRRIAPYQDGRHRGGPYRRERLKA
jgi:homospermidine synthase